MHAALAKSAGQVSRTAADVYEEFFVPALFQQWAAPLIAAARIKSGDRVLDVACGTGALAREMVPRVRPSGAVVGLDRNEGMLAVARRKLPHVEWRTGRAESLPFDDRAFDAVTCQFGLMFFEDRSGALGEMWRVLKPGGRLAVAIWDALDKSPGYADMVALLERLFGKKIADELRAPFVLSDVKALRDMFAQGGIVNIDVRSVDGQARFPSTRAWVETDVKGWTLADLIDDAQFRRLAAAAEKDLAHHVQADGSVAFAAPALIVTAAKS